MLFPYTPNLLHGKRRVIPSEIMEDDWDLKHLRINTQFQIAVLMSAPPVFSFDVAMIPYPYILITLLLPTNMTLLGSFEHFLVFIAHN